MKNQVKNRVIFFSLLTKDEWRPPAYSVTPQVLRTKGPSKNIKKCSEYIFWKCSFFLLARPLQINNNLRFTTALRSLAMPNATTKIKRSDFFEEQATSTGYDWHMIWPPRRFGNRRFWHWKRTGTTPTGIKKEHFKNVLSTYPKCSFFDTPKCS